MKMMPHIQRLIEESRILFQAIQTAGNETRRKVGYNAPFEFLPGLTSTYELYDKGPEHLHYGQYSYLNDLEVGSPVDPTKEDLDDNALFWAMEEVYRRITIKDGEKPVCRIEGRGSFRMSVYEKEGTWEERIKEWSCHSCHAAKICGK